MFQATRKNTFLTLVSLPCFLLTWMGVSACGDGGSRVVALRSHGISYQQVAPGRTITPADLGSVFDTVKYTLEDHDTGPDYRLKDGDATTLKENTLIYQVKGYQPTFRLAAYDRTNTYLQLFEADDNPQAKTGNDLLDIANKVRFMEIKKSNVSIKLEDQQQVAQLVHLVLTAPVDQSRLISDSTEYEVSFYLEDKTTVTRVYGSESRIMARGILLPPTFNDMVDSFFKK